MPDQETSSPSLGAGVFDGCYCSPAGLSSYGRIPTNCLVKVSETMKIFLYGEMNYLSNVNKWMDDDGTVP